MKKNKLFFLVIFLGLLGLSLLVAKSVRASANLLDVSPKNRDGSNMFRSVVIKNISDYSRCRSKECVWAQYGRSIQQEYEYIQKTYGVRGKDWEFPGQDVIPEGTTAVTVKRGIFCDVSLGERHYDKVAIIVFSIGDEKKIYFDITEPYKEALKYEPLYRETEPVEPEDSDE